MLREATAMASARTDRGGARLWERIIGLCTLLAGRLAIFDRTEERSDHLPTWHNDPDSG
jgi:hypothetical protein